MGPEVVVRRAGCHRAGAGGRGGAVRQRRVALGHHPQYWRRLDCRAAVDRLRARKAWDQQALPVRLWEGRRSGRGDGGAHHPIQRRGRRLRGPRAAHQPSARGLLWAVAVAGTVGFVGNEAVAAFRIRVGRQIGSAALVADGYHARTDGWTSLAVVVGAAGVWLGYPLADPIVGLLIAVAILVIVWQSGKTVFTRLLDGVDPT